MKKISTRRPATLLLLNKGDNVVRLTDKTGRCIYKRFLDGVPNNFSVNIPRQGDYFVHGNFSIEGILPLSIPKKKIELPEPERNKFKPFRIEINPNLTGTPARIFTDTGKIEIGDRFKNFAPQIRLFILLHELGHFYYKTEWKTDLFAAYWYLRLGYNKSNAIYALTKVLTHSPNNIERMKKLFNELKK